MEAVAAMLAFTYQNVDRQDNYGAIKCIEKDILNEHNRAQIPQEITILLGIL